MQPTAPLRCSALALGLLAAPLAFAQSDDAAAGADRRTATFAGGCFWCMEPPFDALDGVVSTTSGYMGGDVVDPSYEQVTTGTTGHAEVVQVVYDPGVVSYAELLDVFWPNVDPLDGGGQFCDRGDQYRSAIFYHTPSQKTAAERSLEEVQGRLDGEVVTEITPAAPFYPAEDYHQDYYQKNPIRYNFYRFTCGRAARLDDVWPEERS